MTPSARFSRQTVDGVAVVLARGEIDTGNVHELKAFLENSTDPDGPGIVVDLNGAAYFDSRTIATLAEFCARIRISRQRLAIVAADGGFAAKVLRIAGLTLVVPTLPTVADAVAAVKTPV